MTIGFTDGSSVTAIVKAFWTDPVAARVLFDRFKATRSALGGATLDRVTYSGELVLLFPCDAACAAHREAFTRTLVQKLAALPGIAYAEPERIVNPQAKMP